jgi:Flp pilus assembly protein TadG
MISSVLRNRTGAAAIEFAIMMPIFLLIVVGVTDLGGMLFTHYQLEQAVAAGAEYAAVNASSVNSTSGGTLASSIATLIENANGNGWANDDVVINNGPSVSVTNGSASSSGTASNADNCYCPSGSPPNWSWGSSATCGSTCAAGNNSGKFVTITATATYTPLLTAFNLVQTTTLRQSVVVEAQ